MIDEDPDWWFSTSEYETPLKWPIDDRVRWERDLYVYSDKLEQWIEAPRMKVFELGMVGTRVLMRVGARREWAWGPSSAIQRDELYVGDTPEEIAEIACKDMALPVSVLVIDYGGCSSYSMQPRYWLVTLHSDRIACAPVWPPDDEQRKRDPGIARPRVDMERARVSMHSVLDFGTEIR